MLVQIQLPSFVVCGSRGEKRGVEKGRHFLFYFFFPPLFYFILLLFFFFWVLIIDGMGWKGKGVACLCKLDYLISVWL